MGRDIEDTGARLRLASRVGFLSPAAATLLFLAARLCVGLAEGPEASAAGLAGETSSPTRSVRVLAEIRSAEALPTHDRSVPRTERELLELLRRDRAVVFGADTSEPVIVPTREFTLEEVGVILVHPAPASPSVGAAAESPSIRASGHPRRTSVPERSASATPPADAPAPKTSEPDR